MLIFNRNKNTIYYYTFNINNGKLLLKTELTIYTSFTLHEDRIFFWRARVLLKIK